MAGGLKQQCERDLKTEASLSAAAEANERAVKERDDAVRRLAAECGIGSFAGVAPLSASALGRCSACPRQLHCPGLSCTSWSW